MEGRPASYNVDVFGDVPELSIAGIVLHAGAATTTFITRARSTVSAP
jgi:hypothetical protein